MDASQAHDFCKQVTELIAQSGFAMTTDELAHIDLIDFGLGNFAAEGVATIDIVNTSHMRIKLMVLLPDQTLPQHLHPPYGDHPGKEETIRVISGSMRIYLPGEDCLRDGFVPQGKDACYTLQNEVVLNPTDHLTIEPGVEHWFQAGSEGTVALSFYTQADDDYNRWADPDVTGVAGYEKP